MKKLLCAVAIFTATPAIAADNMFIAAGSIGGERSDYGTVGVAAPLPGYQLGRGWVARAFAEVLTYRYKTGAQTIDATAEGVATTVGYQHSFSEGWWGLYAGPSYRYTDLSPNDPASKTRGSDVAFRLQAEGERNVAARCKFGFNGSYDAFNTHAYWARGRGLYKLSGTLYTGPELAVQGDDDYKAWQAGWVLTGIQFSPSSGLGISAGMRKNQDYSASPYVGLEFGALF